jgi:8-oxo-dGTP diphosphatase
VTRFCPRCGERLPGPPPIECSACAYALFVNPRPTATAIIVDDGRILTLLRAREPQKGRWELPGGFSDGFEHPAETVVREVREELGVEIRLDEFVGMYLGAYEFQGEQLPVLDCFWLATIVGGDLRVDPTEADDHAWTPVGELPEFGFETMNRAVADVLARLK